MPISPPIVIPNQVLPTPGVLPYVQQMNFGAMIGTVAGDANPNALAKVPVWINEIVRQVYAKKTWYGLYVKGQVVCPNATNGGQATVTLGSQTVTGTNTNWTQALIGQQFRLGLNAPPYTITQVSALTTPQTLTLELPWGGPLPPNQTSMTAGYTILQMFYDLGPNIRYLKQMVNLTLGFKMWLNLTQDYLDNRDPWRIYQNFPWGVAPLPTTPNGHYLVELWPAPIVSQCLPWLGYITPPNLVNDSDTLPAYIRCDVILKEARAWALRYKPKENPGYDAQYALALANTYHQEFQGLLADWMNEDENLYRTSATIPGEDLPFYTPGGAIWAAEHAVMNSYADEGW